MTTTNNEAIKRFKYGATSGGSRNVFADGDTLYSYGHHFPLAVRYRRKQSFCFLLNSDSYSCTTSCHQGDCFWSLKPGINVSFNALTSEKQPPYRIPKAWVAKDLAGYELDSFSYWREVLAVTNRGKRIIIDPRLVKDFQRETNTYRRFVTDLCGKYIKQDALNEYVLQDRRKHHYIVYAGIALSLYSSAKLYDLSDTDILRLWKQFPSCGYFPQQIWSRKNILKGEKFTLAQLGRIRNVELRQKILAEAKIVGLDKPIQQDDFGKLFRVDKDVKAFVVTCPSTGKEHILGVPAACQSGRDAYVWINGFDIGEDVKVLAEA